MTIFQGIAGLAAFVGLAWIISENRRQVKIKTIAMGLCMQLLLALVLLKIPLLGHGFALLNQEVLALEQSTRSESPPIFLWEWWNRLCLSGPMLDPQ